MTFIRQWGRVITDKRNHFFCLCHMSYQRSSPIKMILDMWWILLQWSMPHRQMISQCSHHAICGGCASDQLKPDAFFDPIKLQKHSLQNFMLDIQGKTTSNEYSPSLAYDGPVEPGFDSLVATSDLAMVIEHMEASSIITRWNGDDEVADRRYRRI